MGKVIVILCTLAILQGAALASPTKTKREVDSSGNDDYISDYEDRNERASPTTYPPFPGYGDWWWGDSTESDGSNYVIPTAEPEEEEVRRTTPFVRDEYEREETTKTPNSGYSFNEIEAHLDKGREHFHKKIVPWVKKTWGHARNFFQKHYDNISG